MEEFFLKALFKTIIVIAIVCSISLFVYDAKFSCASEDLPFHEGEQLIYDVYYKKIRIGKSILTFQGEKEIDGKKLYHISFSTNLHGYKDVEEIYADKKTFLPYRVFRIIKPIGKFPTRIEEEYDQDAFMVKIKKKSMLFTRKFTIQKNAPIHNAILLPYYYRIKPRFRKTEKFKVTLPTTDFDVILKGKEEISTRLGKYSAYVFDTIPQKFTFWLSADKRRIPIKIESHAALSHFFLGYSLVINSIK